MDEYIDWSARDCDAECAAQVIQSSQDVSQSAQQAAASAAEATIVLEEVTTMVNDLHDISESTEGQVIQLRIDVRQLTDDINLLRLSIDDSMVPTIDNSILLLIIATLGAFTVCIVVCLGVIGYTSYVENKKRVIQSSKKRKHGYIRRKLPF
tara:strand:+ start:8806 stop:9261 length:456 start_codon:yes stop_codon:yes gene_type:complete